MWSLFGQTQLIRHRVGRSEQGLPVTLPQANPVKSPAHLCRPSRSGLGSVRSRVQMLTVSWAIGMIGFGKVERAIVTMSLSQNLWSCSGAKAQARGCTGQFPSVNMCNLIRELPGGLQTGMCAQQTFLCIINARKNERGWGQPSVTICEEEFDILL